MFPVRQSAMFVLYAVALITVLAPSSAHAETGIHSAQLRYIILVAIGGSGLLVLMLLRKKPRPLVRRNKWAYWVAAIVLAVLGAVFLGPIIDALSVIFAGR